MEKEDENDEMKIEWKNNVELPDGKYSGEMKGGKRYGYGLFLYKDGRKYNGEWKNDKRDGQGHLEYKDKQSFRGEFKNGVRHGIGVFKNFAGILETQEFEKGVGVKVENLELYSKNYFDQPGRGGRGRNRGRGRRTGFPTSPIAGKDLSGKHPITNYCPYVRASWNFIEFYLGMSTKWFRFDWNVCFCPRCKKNFNRETGERGKKLYSYPFGWTKFALPVPPFFSSSGSLDNWHVGFHGTRPETAKIIIEQSRGGLLMPGDFTPSGFELPVANPLEGKDEKWMKQFFMSPSIKYCETMYTPEVEFNGDIFQVAFQVRIEPGTYEEGPQTIKPNEVIAKIDPKFDNEKIEWYTPRRNVAVLSGLLIKRIFDGVAKKNEKEKEKVKVKKEEVEGEEEEEEQQQHQQNDIKEEDDLEVRRIEEEVLKLKKKVKDLNTIIEEKEKEIEERKKKRGK